MNRKNDLRSLREEQDATLIREAQPLQAKLGLHTVPVFFLKGKPEEGNVTGAGSGILFHLEDRYFILTAGHCVKDGKSADNLAVHVTTHPRRFTLYIVNSDFHFVDDGKGGDYGFWEVAERDAMQMQAINRTFLSADSIEVLTSGDLKERNDWMVLSGYPDKLTKKTPRSTTVRLLQYSTIIAGTGSAPTSELETVAKPTDIVDLWVPQTGNVDALADDPSEIDVPSLRGASGGGCWYSQVRALREGWTPEKIKLVGIHTGTCQATQRGDGSTHVFAREALIANHLRLIANTCGESKAYIDNRWPELDLSIP
jgi:hypothetical protein